MDNKEIQEKEKIFKAKIDLKELFQELIVAELMRAVTWEEQESKKIEKKIEKIINKIEKIENKINNNNIYN